MWDATGLCLRPAWASLGRMKIRYLALAVLLVLLSSAGMKAADVEIKQVPLSTSELLTLQVPAPFQLAVVKESEDGFRPAIRLLATNTDGSIRVVLKIFTGKIQDKGPQNQEELNAAVQKMSAVYVSGSVEKTNTVYVLKLPQAGSLGAYTIYTDVSLVSVLQPPPGQYRVVMLGMARIGDYLFTIQCGSEDRDGEDFKAALKMMAGLKVDTEAVKEDSQPAK